MHDTNVKKPWALAASIAAACLALTGCGSIAGGERSAEIDRFLGTQKRDSSKRIEEIDQTLGIRKTDTARPAPDGRTPGVAAPLP
jgi:hypothetical protein